MNRLFYIVSALAVIGIVGVLAYHYLAPPSPNTSPGGIIAGATIPPSTTAISSISAHPYISASQAQTFLGAISSSAVKNYNTSAELSTLGYGGMGTNATAAWTVMYGGPDNADLTEVVLLMNSSERSQSLYMSIVAQGSSNNKLVYGVQNGMNYAALSNQTTHTSGMFGWKGPYIAMIITNATVNTTEVAAVASADLP